MDNLDLKKLTLRNFRSYKNLDLQFNSKFIYFSGPNGIGKTNILEAISLFSPGRGLRNANISDLNQVKNKNLWHLTAILNISNIFMEIEIGLDKTGKKHLRIDGKKKPLFCLTPWPFCEFRFVVVEINFTNSSEKSTYPSVFQSIEHVANKFSTFLKLFRQFEDQ